MAKKLFVEINGETKSITEWAIISGVNAKTIHSRYDNGVRGEDLIRKVDNRGSSPILKVNIDGTEYTMTELSVMYDIDKSLLYARYKRGKRGKDLIKPVNEFDSSYKGFVHELWHGKWVFTGK
ncbi:MAG: hypothetical protein PUG48_10850 [Clostridia bacterium]|nr:hypothetical protein [Clostridia bacterium]